MWLLFAFISASLLGIYDIFKKLSLNSNAVMPVLFFNTLISSLLFLPIIILSYCFPDTIQNSIFYLPKISFNLHIYLIFKAVIVLTSWVFTYYSLKHLPITLASPIKSMQPIFTLLGALFIFGEILNLYQWVGVILAILSFLLLSRSGKKEGIRFAHNKWIYFMVLAVITGSMSGLYDKYLMSRTDLDRMNVQVWYNYYQLLIMGILVLALWYPNRSHTTPFKWRNSIPFISIFLVAADFVYFYALSYEDSMISVVSLVRRSSVVVSFFAGAFIFKEKNLKSKLFDLLLIIISMYFIYLGTTK